MEPPRLRSPEAASDAVLELVARLLRRYHDDQTPVPDRPPSTVVCHNDVRPGTVVFEGARPVALRPSPWAAPGPRLWDVAGAVWRWVPLLCDWDTAELGFDPDRDHRGQRLRAFSDSYGLVPSERARLLDTVELRLEVADAIRADTAFADREGWSKLRDERAGEGVLRDRWFVEEFRDGFARHLGD